MFLASTTYDKQLIIEKTGLSHQVWSHGGSSFRKDTIGDGGRTDTVDTIDTVDTVHTVDTVDRLRAETPFGK